jgi:uncharacterized protein YyaL (SSP411 family)
MAHESFEDPAVAAVMNDNFISIKVDREERPDIDAIYQAALALMGQPGGWPLTMFLTPDGEPFWGGTYFPPTARYGRPAFADVLKRVATTFHAHPASVRHNVEALRTALATLGDGHPGPGIAPSFIDTVADGLLRDVDPRHGGLAGAPKFPQTAVFELLWRAALRTGRTDLRTAVVTTLTHMCQGGIYDHLGGGISRYSTDEAWLAPHFEKMLYDNAQLIDLATLVWQDTRAPLLAARVHETVGWLLRDMTVEGEAFASSRDADSEGEEGRYYVWNALEIDRLLHPHQDSFKAVYNVTTYANWEGGNILNRLGALELGDGAAEARLAAQRAHLLAVRDDREPPARDDKVLADWNGLAIAALANAGAVFDQPAWIGHAARAFAFVAGTLGHGDRLHHSWRAGRTGPPGTLDDYANMARAALALYEATGDHGYIGRAGAWARALDIHFLDHTHGGYFFTADDAEGLIVRTKTAADSPTPSGNATMVGVLARLNLLTGEPAWRTRAEALVTAFSGGLTRNAQPYATLLNTAEFLATPQETIVIGPPDDPATAALRRAVLDRCLPNRLLMAVADSSALPLGHPAHARPLVAGRPTAYVCQAMTCSPPVTDPAALAALLESR